MVFSCSTRLQCVVVIISSNVHVTKLYLIVLRLLMSSGNLLRCDVGLTWCRMRMLRSVSVKTKDDGQRPLL